jgi:hypothetical protein
MKATTAMRQFGRAVRAEIKSGAAFAAPKPAGEGTVIVQAIYADGSSQMWMEKNGTKSGFGALGTVEAVEEQILRTLELLPAATVRTEDKRS